MKERASKMEGMVSRRLGDDAWDARMARRVFHVRRVRKIRLALILGALVMAAGLGGAAGWEEFRSGQIARIWSPAGVVSVASWSE